MDIKQDLEAILVGHVHEPVDLLLGTISAANVGTVLIEGPVTNRDTDDVNLLFRKSLEVILEEPAVPMGLKHSVTLFGSENLADGVLIDSDLRFTFIVNTGLGKETVEERRGNPGLEDLPTSNVGTSDLGSGTFSSSNSGKCGNSE